MTLQHLMGGTQKKMEKFVALSTPNLLVSTLHRDDDDKVIPEDSDTGSKSSEISGIERIEDDLDEQEMSPETTQHNFVSQTLIAENMENVSEERGVNK